MKHAGRFVWELLQILLISAAIILPIRYFLIQPFYVKGASMEPEFQDGEYLIINEIEYRLQNPERGDVIVFRYPPDPSEFFIKRVIGLPGEKVEIAEGIVRIYNEDHPNGVILNEPYLGSGVRTPGRKTVQVGEGEYFVLGDNREASLDSRAFGSVPRSDLIGRVWVRGFPFAHATVFRTIEYSL
ncbi:MAG TPA: signal peptidase I [Patescibacteria group bacterium]|nr:signal peptidase I [Patescibacteria group bacterium]